MSRKVLDRLASGVGAVLTVLLLIAGGLLMYGSHFTHSQVTQQLSIQQIYFPTMTELNNPKPPEITSDMKHYLGQYAGKQLTTGPEAEAFANHYIRRHLEQMPYGGVYSKVSEAYLADPKNATLAAERQTTFMGTTLRGMLLNAYAFWTVGTVMLWGAIASFVGAVILAVLTLLGLRHSKIADAKQSGDERLDAAGDAATTTSL